MLDNPIGFGMSSPLIVIKLAGLRLPRSIASGLLMAGLSLAFANLVFPNWTYISLGFIDNWLYWGTGESFAYISEWFSLTYYFRRWTLTAPYILLNLLGIQGATALIFLANTQLAILAFITGAYVQSLVGKRLTAISISAVALLTPGIVLSVGNGYYTAAVLIFSVGTLLALRIAFHSGRERIFMFFSGLLFVFALISYQGLILSVPIFFAMWWAEARARQAPGGLRLHLQALWVSFGAVLAVIVDWSMGFLLSNGWPDLVSYSISTSVGLAESGDWGIAPTMFLQALLVSGWTQIPLMITGTASLFLLPKDQRRSVVPVAIGVFGAFALHVVASLLGGNPLFVHSVVLFQFLQTLLLGVLFGRVISTRHSQIWVRLTLVVLIFSALLIAANVTFPVGVIWLSAAAAFLVVTSRRKANHFPFSDSGLAATTLFVGLIFAIVAAGTSKHVGSGQNFSLPAPVNSPEELYSEIEDDLRFANLVTGATQARIWIQDNRDWPGWSPITSSLYGLYSAVSVQAFPNELDCGQVGWILSQDYSVILVFDNRSASEVLNEIEMLFRGCDPSTRFGLSSLSEPGRVVLVLHGDR